MTDLKILLLAGGQSSRMGQPKHLLKLQDQPNFVRLLVQLRSACPDAHAFISLKDESAVASVTQSMSSMSESSRAEVIFDEKDGIGPAAGLLAAYRTDSTCRWLVVACDFPLLRSDDILQLIKAYEDPVTCFQNSEGWTEPLLAIWSAPALRMLSDSVQAGRTGPNRVVHLLNGKMIRPHREASLFNTNTPDEWERAKKLV